MVRNASHAAVVFFSIERTIRKGVMMSRSNPVGNIQRRQLAVRFGWFVFLVIVIPGIGGDWPLMDGPG